MHDDDDDGRVDQRPNDQRRFVFFARSLPRISPQCIAECIINLVVQETHKNGGSILPVLEDPGSQTETLTQQVSEHHRPK